MAKKQEVFATPLGLARKDRGVLVMVAERSDDSAEHTGGDPLGTTCGWCMFGTRHTVALHQKSVDENEAHQKRLKVKKPRKHA